MRRHLAQLACSCAVTGLLASPATAAVLSPEQVFEKAAPSIVVVRVFKGSGKPAALGSGVIVRRDEVVTNCHVIAAGETAYVVKEERRFLATLLFADVDRDLCLLMVRGLNGTPVEFGTLGTVKPGARVFAIGSPRGLELTITDGLVSGLRVIENSHIIQTSAPISTGSSGGGLFDTSGRLVGITTFTLVESQNLNFALPVDWVVQLQKRAAPESERLAAARKAQIADRGAAASSFSDPDSANKWLAEMGKRVAPFIPEANARGEFLKIAHYEAVRARLDPQLVLALVEKISEFQKFSVSSTGARGYMQVMPTWVSRIGTPADNLFHLRTNLRYGCVILRHYIDKHNGDLLKGLNAYRNQSVGRPDSFAVDTQLFAKDVVNLWRSRWQYAAAHQPRTWTCADGPPTPCLYTYRDGPPHSTTSSL